MLAAPAERLGRSLWLAPLASVGARHSRRLWSGSCLRKAWLCAVRRRRRRVELAVAVGVLVAAVSGGPSLHRRWTEFWPGSLAPGSGGVYVWDSLPVVFLGMVFGGGYVRALAWVVDGCSSILIFSFQFFIVFLFRHPGSGAQWFVVVTTFGVYVDGNGGLGFFPRDVLPWSSPLTIQINVDDRFLIIFVVGSSGLMPWIARFGPLRASPCVRGKIFGVLFCFALLFAVFICLFFVQSVLCTFCPVWQCRLWRFDFSVFFGEGFLRRSCVSTELNALFVPGLVNRYLSHLFVRSKATQIKSEITVSFVNEA